MSTASDTVCTADQLEISGSSGFHCLTRTENVGLVAVPATGFVSLIALVVVFTHILNRIRTRSIPEGVPWRIINQPMDIFIISLFLGSFLQAIGAVLNVKWIGHGIVSVGSFCTAQGLTQNIGQSSVAISTLIITLHTFSTIWSDRGVKMRRTAYILVGLQWLFLVPFAAISARVHKRPPFYAPTPYWCWINSVYPNYRYALENVWLWLAFAASLLYIPLFFWSQGYITPGTAWWDVRIVHEDERVARRNRNSLSVSLLLCALAYTAPVLPTSFARWLVAVHGDTKPFTTVAGQYTLKAIFTLSGACDSIAFLLARQGLLTPQKAFPDLDPQQKGEPADAQGILPQADDNANNILPAAGPGEVVENQYFGRRSSRHSPLRMSALIFLWLLLNGLHVLWVVFYIHSAVNSVPRTGANRTHPRWEAFFTLSTSCFLVLEPISHNAAVHLWGFTLGAINLGVWYFYLLRVLHALHPQEDRHEDRPVSISQRPISIFQRLGGIKVFRVFYWTFHTALVLPLAIFMIFGPFVGPYIALKVSQRHAWLHRCDPNPVEVVLVGRSYLAPRNVEPQASFYTGPPGSRTFAYDYNLTQDTVGESVWHFLLNHVEPNSAKFALPAVQHVIYRFSNHTFTASCTVTGDPAGEAEPCLHGSFVEDGPLSFTIDDARSGTETRFRTINKDWAFTPADDAPSYELKAVQQDGTLRSDLVLRTAVTKRGECQKLKLCIANVADIDALAPIVGLTLLRQSAFSDVCTTPNSN